VAVTIYEIKNSSSNAQGTVHGEAGKKIRFSVCLFGGSKLDFEAKFTVSLPKFNRREVSFVGG